MIKKPNEEQRRQILEATLKSIQKDFGISGSQVYGDQKVVKIERVSSGSYKIDLLIGGGYPRGRIIEIYGPESSGKTTVCLHAIAEVQRHGGLAVFIDAEHALDPIYAKALGVDMDNLIVAQPDTAEDALQIAERWMDSGIVDMVVIDSVAALVPRAELNGEIGDAHVGILARLMSQTLKRLAGKAYRTGTILLFVNQIREKVGVMFSNPEVTTGGRALKFYASVRMEVRPAEIRKKGGEAVSRTTKIKIVKSKVSPPFREDTVDIEFGEGISKAGEILDFGVDFGIIEKSGNWYSYKGEKLGNGRDAAKQFLKENPHLMDELDKRIRQYIDPLVEEGNIEEDEHIEDISLE